MERERLVETVNLIVTNKLKKLESIRMLI